MVTIRQLDHYFYSNKEASIYFYSSKQPNISIYFSNQIVSILMFIHGIGERIVEFASILYSRLIWNIILLILET